MMDAARIMTAKANDRIDKRLAGIGKSPIKNHGHATIGLCETGNPGGCCAPAVLTGEGLDFEGRNRPSLRHDRGNSNSAAVEGMRWRSLRRDFHSSATSTLVKKDRPRCNFPESPTPSDPDQGSETNPGPRFCHPIL